MKSALLSIGYSNKFLFDNVETASKIFNLLSDGVQVSEVRNGVYVERKHEVELVYVEAFMKPVSVDEPSPIIIYLIKVTGHWLRSIQ